jgi:hypothetical protein
VSTTPVLKLKRGDTAPRFRARVLDGTTPLSLIAAASVKLLMKGNGISLALPVTIEPQTGNDGWVYRNWAATDLAVAGVYQGELEVTWGDGTIQTFPGDSTFTILVSQDLG